MNRKSGGIKVVGEWKESIKNGGQEIKKMKRKNTWINYYKDYYYTKLKDNLEFIKKRKARDKEYYYKNREKLLLKKRKYAKLYSQTIRGKQKKLEWREKCKLIPSFKDKTNLWSRKAKRNNIHFRLCSNLRTRLWTVLNRYLENGKIGKSRNYGINFKDIIEHLKPFPKNINKYQIDHIIPLSLFNFNDAKQIKIAFAPENHQWLTKHQNIIKGNKLVYPSFKEAYK